MKLFVLFAAWVSLAASAALAQSIHLTVNTGGSVNCVTTSGESGFNIDAWAIGGKDLVSGFHATGTLVSPPRMGDLSISKSVDACSAQLQQKFLMEAALPSFVLTQYSSGIRPVALLVITLTNPTMTSYQLTGTTGERPLESVSFTFTKVCLKEQKQNADGSQGSSTQICYDRLTNTTS